MGKRKQKHRQVELAHSCMIELRSDQASFTTCSPPFFSSLSLSLVGFETLVDVNIATPLWRDRAILDYSLRDDLECSRLELNKARAHNAVEKQALYHPVPHEWNSVITEYSKDVGVSLHKISPQVDVSRARYRPIDRSINQSIGE